MEKQEIKRAYYAMLVSNGHSPARDCYSVGETPEQAVDGVISALAEAEGITSAELIQDIGEPFPDPMKGEGRYSFHDYGDTYIYVREQERVDGEEDCAQACDCTACPAWGEFLDNARAYPCDGCKWADDEYSGDFDPFEDGAE